MIKKNKKIEIKACENDLEGSSSTKKHKHNSKRRKRKNTQKHTDINGENTTCRVNDVVNFLCTAISQESEISVNSNAMKFSTNPKKAFQLSSNDFSCDSNNFISNKEQTSLVSKLSNVLENLKVDDLKNLKKLNKTLNCFDNHFTKDFILEKSAQDKMETFKRKKKKMKNDSRHVEFYCQDSLKEYISIQNNQRKSGLNQIFSESVSDLETFFMCDLFENERIPKNDKFLRNQLNLNFPINTNHEFLNSSDMTTGFHLNTDEKKTKDIHYEINKKIIKKKSQKENLKNLDDKFEISDNTPKSLNFGSLEKSNNLELFMSINSNLPKSSKKQRSTKNSCSSEEKDTKFPKYLSSEELQSLSNFGVLMSGIIRINQKNYKEAYITAPDKGLDILIEGLKDRNRALEGDEVYFVLKIKEHHRTGLDSTDIQRTAAVVAIKTKNHNRGVIGTLNVIKNPKVHFALFTPRDTRLPRLRIRKNHWPSGFSENSETFQEKLYFAKISQWNDLRFADGEIIKEVGLIGNIEAETKAILLSYDLDVTPYNENLLWYLPTRTFQIPDFEIQHREDFRQKCIFTIDPASAVDLDDALGCEQLPNGNFEVGVHISDVSYFLEEKTPLDIAISKRATTIYLVQKAYHMLPLDLCQLCSLTPGSDKLTFSVLWEVSPECQIISHRFTRSVINSCAQFSYEQVQSVIEGSNNFRPPRIFGNHSLEHIINVILFLNKIARKLRSERFSEGALRIDQRKIWFNLDSNHLPINYTIETHEESHQLVEEFMLLANITVAKRLHTSFPDIAFLRSHSPPIDYILKKLKKTLEKYGIILDTSTAGSIQSSLLKYSGDDIESKARMLVLNNLLAKPMVRAKYYCAGFYPNKEDRFHYALNVPLYTHFTSPIRRYADIMTHRLLAASLSYCKLSRCSIDEMQSIADNCNKQKYAAKMAGENSIELYLSVYIGLCGALVCEAIICDIKDRSFDCIDLSSGSHQRIYYERIKGAFNLEKEDEILRLTVLWPKDETHKEETIQIIEMFSIVKIELKKENDRKIEATLLRYEEKN